MWERGASLRPLERLRGASHLPHALQLIVLFRDKPRRTAKRRCERCRTPSASSLLAVGSGQWALWLAGGGCRYAGPRVAACRLLEVWQIRVSIARLVAQCASAAGPHADTATTLRRRLLQIPTACSAEYSQARPACLTRPELASLAEQH